MNITSKAKRGLGRRKGIARCGDSALFDVGSQLREDEVL
jgi:hypothetical protein